MTRVLTIATPRPTAAMLALAVLVTISLMPLCARGAKVTEDAVAVPEPGRLEGGVGAERVVVDPEPAWDGWGEWHDGGPRIDVWVDRGDWGSYRSGDRLWVYFRVDRECYVTIIDYATDGSVDVVFPNRWSGSNFARPGRTYRVPESRRYSLRIAGPGGVETLVACAHQSPWPSGPRGRWIPPSRPRRGRVVVGGPGGRVPPGRPGRAVSPGRVWPIPYEWHARPTGWGCDEVSFHVVGDGWWHGGPRGSDSWDGGHDVFHDRFRMRDCGDSFYRDVYFAGRSAAINIECTESRSGDPTEIVGRLILDGGWGSRPLFRIDVEGRHGDRPVRGRTYVEHAGPLRVEVRVDDFEIERHGTSWTPARIDWIRFDVRAFGD